jgi:CheY-like chemotaxis protein/DNA-binding XRE family transcriptional regulator
MRFVAIEEFAVVSVRISQPVLESSHAEVNGGDTATESRPTAQENSGLYCASEVRILVLDDDQSICRMIQAALASGAFSVDTVSDPSSVQQVLQARLYHVIILDYVLPGLETEQVLEWIRESQPDASIIVVTAYPSIDSALSCLRARTYDYITKPFQVSHLQRVVTRCLESRGLLRMSEEALRESLGAVIRERRKGLGLTLAQMAQRTGVSLGYLSQIELGKNSASIETLYRISLGLGMKMSELFQTVQNPG